MMSAYLLDTHVLYWLAVQPERVPKAVKKLLEDADRLLISAASAYEIGQKVRLGKLPTAVGLVSRWPHLAEQMMAEVLSLTANEMLHASTLTWAHRDPFDRMLVAQAQLNDLKLVTQDEAMRAFAGVSCVEWR